MRLQTIVNETVTLLWMSLALALMFKAGRIFYRFVLKRSHSGWVSITASVLAAAGTSLVYSFVMFTIGGEIFALPQFTILSECLIDAKCFALGLAFLGGAVLEVYNRSRLMAIKN